MNFEIPFVVAKAKIILNYAITRLIMDDNKRKEEKTVKIKIYYEIVETNDREFMDEREKKKFLDLFLQAKKCSKLKLYAFCMTDSECHFLFDSSSEQEVIQVEEQTMKAFSAYYNKQYQGCFAHLVRKKEYQRWMTEDEILTNCLKLHLMPTEKRLARNPEDYWWSSYVDYRRQYRKGVVDTELVLKHLDSDRKCAVQKLINLHRTLHNI